MYSSENPVGGSLKFYGLKVFPRIKRCEIRPISLFGNSVDFQYNIRKWQQDNASNSEDVYEHSLVIRHARSWIGYIFQKPANNLECIEPYPP
jgi:hypothetical protein